LRIIDIILHFIAISIGVKLYKLPQHSYHVMNPNILACRNFEGAQNQWASIGGNELIGAITFADGDGKA